MPTKENIEELKSKYKELEYFLKLIKALQNGELEA